jgi:hypothetical protein
MKATKIKYLIFVILASFSIGFSAKAVTSDILTVLGNQFMFNNSPIVLSGLAMGDPHDRIVNYKRYSKADYKTIKNDWQANVVRLSVHPGVFLKDWAKGKKILEDEVAIARSNGLFVIIDWHVIGEPDGWYKNNTDKNNKYYTYNSDFSTAKKFWQYAAKKFKSDRGIIFELWNEPVNEDDDLSWNEMRPYLTELVELIRNAESKNVILAPGMNWSYDLRGIKENPLSGENIAYSWHVYNNNGSTISREVAMDDLNKVYPIFITEWGSNNDSDFGFTVQSGQNVYGYLESVKNLITSLNLSNTAWCWHSSWKPKMFNEDWRWANSYGSLVKDFLKYPDKVRERLKADEKKKQELAQAVEKANQAQTAQAKAKQEKENLTREFKLRVESYIINGADANSVKLGEKERRAILSNFVTVYGDQPKNESQWQDLIKINNGYWPSNISQTAEDKAKKDFKKIFNRTPDMNNAADKHTIKILAYDIHQRPGQRSLDKERAAVTKFKKIFKHLPSSSTDWKFIRALAYSGVKK